MADLQDATILSTFDFWAWCDAQGFVVSGDISDVQLSSLSTDTRTLQQGALFVALVGERFDAHDFLEKAYNQGACAALVSKSQGSFDAPDGMILIFVPDTLLALQMLAAALWQELLERGVKTISLTGSNGKTTSKELLRALCSFRHKVHATYGNYNNHIGVPLTICATPCSAEVVILEMGASKRGDIKELTEIAPAHARLICSIGYAHLEGMGGLDGVRQTKSEIFIGSNSNTVAVVPDDEFENLIPEDFQGQALSFGGSTGDVRAAVLGQNSEGMKVQLSFADATADVVVDVSLQGEHNARNLAACVAIVRGLGEAMSEEELGKALKLLVIPGGRSEVLRHGDLLFLNDSYNANPSSMLASFQAFMGWSEEFVQGQGLPRIAVIGQMAEVGPESKNWHLEVARRMVDTDGLDALVFVGDYAHEMKVEAEKQRGQVEVLASENLKDVALWLTKQGRGVIFLKASRSARLERLIELIQDG